MREKGSTKYTKNAYSFKSWPRSNSSSNSSTEYSEKRKKNVIIVCNMKYTIKIMGKKG